MKKKFLFALPAIIAGMLATSALANDVAKIGDVGYSTFAEALSVVKDNDVIYLLDDADASSVAFSPCNGKSVIITGQTGNEVLNMGDGHKGGISNANITFLNLKMQIRHTLTSGLWYTEGMYHATKIKYENVVFDGVITTLDDVDFLNCTFTSNPQNIEYTTWNYGGTQIFKGCKFEAASMGTSSFIKLYNQGAPASVAVIDCEFTLPDELPGGYKGNVVYSSNPSGVASAAKEYTSGNKVNGVETTVVKYKDGCAGVTVCATTEEMGITVPTPTVLPTNAVAKIGNDEYPTLAAAIAAVPANGEVVTITLIDDENILGNAGVTINAGQNIILNLNGKTVKNLVNENKASQLITNKGTLTITGDGTMTNELADGTIAGDWPTYNYATNLITNAGTLTIENGTFNNTQDSGICYTIDNNSSGADAILTINGGTFTSVGNSAVRMFCNNTAKQNSLTVNGGVLTAHYYAVSMQNPNSNANNGSLAINGGEFNATDEEEGYNCSVYCSAASSNFDVAITGGTFNDNIAIPEGNKSTTVSGGTFAYATYTYPGKGTYDLNNYLAEGYELKENPNGTFGPVEAESYVCEIGDKKYPSLAAAVAAVPANGEEVTIKMIDNEAIDVAGSGITIAKDQNIKLDLNGFTIAGVCSTGAGSNLVVNNGTLVVEDNSEEKTGKMTYGVTPAWVDDGDDDYSGSYASNLFKNYGKLTINSGYYENAGAGSACYVIDNYESGEVVLNDGYFKAASTAIRLFYGNGGLVIEDGTVEAVAGYDVISFSGSTSANSIEINGGDFIAKKGGFNVYAWAEGANSESSLTVTDGTFNAWVANSEKFSDNISIEGGDIYGFWSYNPEVKEVISGGTFTCAPGLDYLAEDCALSVNEDGTYSPIVCEESETITYYVGNNEKVDATFAEWKEAVKSNPNTIVVVDKELEGFAMANVNVVVEDENGNYCPYLALTDLSDFYSPVDFTATEGEYARENTSGLNSVCMPFELSVEDVNGVIGVVYSDATRAGEVVTKVEFTEQDNVVPGTPCIVKSSSNAWNIDLTGRQIVGSLKDDYVDSPALKGSFTTKGYYEISTTDNSYKISSDGTVFVQCIEGSQVFPFRACFDMGNSEASKSISISWRDNGTTDILLPVEDGTESEIFDIMGRRVSQPMKGGMYIVNGQKIVY